MQFNILTLEQALPMYIKLKQVMNQYKKEEIPMSRRSLEKQCEEELYKIRRYATFYGYPDTCLAVYINNSDEDRIPIIDLYVDENHRNQGLGTNLLRFCKKLNDVLYLNVMKENTRALKFYTREGFRIQDEDDMIRMMWEKDRKQFEDESDSFVDFSQLTRKLRNLR